MKVTQLWRFPVKSMGGTEVEAVRIDRRGVHADRLWAVRDVEKGVTASARRVPALLGCSARYTDEPGDDAGPGNVPQVVITFPNGRELAGDDPAVNDALTELVGREMRLVALPPARYTTPPGTFVDLSPVHVLSTASLQSLAADGTPFDVRRFRPNVLVDAGNG